ncbi:hypothetical protein L7F22_050095 [Adiantum nelumboides]|nr:hypothetical protein [Adiantum nelumboides]
MYVYRVLDTTFEKLQHDFKETHEGAAKQPVEAARIVLEYCCFKALSQLMQHKDFLHEVGFRHFTFDFMVAWEAPLANDDKQVESGKPQAEEDASLFFSDLMPLVVEAENSVGLEAFKRIAPCIPIIADAISVHPQFETLTASTSGRLPFPIYDKYLEALERSLRTMKEKNELSFLKKLPMSEEEHVLEIDGISKMVIQHVGTKATRGRLTLTDHCLYFEPSSLFSHKDAIKYDLSLHIDHKVSPDLTGPLGSRVIDKAISYHSTHPERHVVFEFPEMVGSWRRDYWLAIIQEVIDTHKVIRKYNLEGACKLELLARCIMGIVRLQATKGFMQVLISSPGALLSFNMSQSFLQGGDYVLEALSITLKNAIAEEIKPMDSDCFVQVSFSETLEGFKVWKKKKNIKRMFYKVKHGEPTLLQVAVEEAMEGTKYVNRNMEKVEEIKPDGIAKNILLTKELLGPITKVWTWIKLYVSWDDPFYSLSAFFVVGILILRGWFGYIVPVVLAAAGMHNVWLISGKAMEQEVTVDTSLNGVNMDEVITAQRAVSQIEDFLQTLNISLLKVLAIILSVQPEAKIYKPVVLLILALLLAIIPVKYIIFLVHLLIFIFTLRDKTSDYKILRRLREIWYGIPPIPVHMVKSDADEEKKD